MCVRHIDEGNYEIVNKHQMEKAIFLLDGLTPMKTSVGVYTDLNREVSLPLSTKVSSRLNTTGKKLEIWSLSKVKKS